MDDSVISLSRYRMEQSKQCIKSAKALVDSETNRRRCVIRKYIGIE